MWQLMLHHFGWVSRQELCTAFYLCAICMYCNVLNYHIYYSDCLTFWVFIGIWFLIRPNLNLSCKSLSVDLSIYLLVLVPRS